MTSKKRSGANSRLKPPKPPVFFIDRSLGKKAVADALRQANLEVHVHDEYFPRDARDEEWLAEVGRRGWVVLTKDTRIRYRAAELAALMRSGVTAFVLTSGNLRGAEMAEIFLKALPAICRLVARYTPPFVASVTKSGSVSLLVRSSQKKVK
jgi:predicted nuclease of predicted toxin-antitoxin system